MFLIIKFAFPGFCCLPICCALTSNIQQEEKNGEDVLPACSGWRFRVKSLRTRTTTYFASMGKPIMLLKQHFDVQLVVEIIIQEGREFVKVSLLCLWWWVSVMITMKLLTEV